MSGGLYERDILAWSVHQADLIRRLARDERVSGIDWDNLAEEIESVGLSELRVLESFLRRMMVHLLKLHAWPDSDARNHWEAELAGCQDEAKGRFTPSMRQRVDVPALYGQAVRQVRRLSRDTAPPEACPFTLDQLLNDELEGLLGLLPGTG
jgi:Domain of unknown function DUF29